MRRRPALLAVLLLTAALLVRSQAGRAADPLPYTVEIAPSGDADIDRAAADASTLRSLREDGPLAPLALIARARADAERLQAAMASLGHYAGTAEARIAGRPLDDPGLADLLAGLPDGTAAEVALRLTPGPPTTLRRIALTGEAPGFLRETLTLKPGDVARAEPILAARTALREALRAQGHALAEVDAPDAVLDPASGTLDVAYAVRPGPRVAIGTISFTGQDRMDKAVLRRRLALREGEPFDPAAIARARADLAGLPPLAGVRIEEGTATDAFGRLPLTVAISERKPRSIALAATYATDQGGSLSAAWTHRNLFGGGERLTLTAAATELGGSAIRAPGFLADGQLVLPDFLARDQSLSLGLAARREYLRAYDREAFLAAATLRRKLDPELTIGAGLAAQQARIRQEGDTRDYTLLQAPLTLTWDTTTAPLDPTSGIRAGLALTPTLSLGGTGTQVFLIAQATGAAYLDLGATPGRSVLAGRALIGLTEGAGRADIPPDQRFYGGGSATIRGYSFQSVGPAFASGRPAGGSAISTGSIELRQRIGADWGAVAFLDAGQVSDSGTPFTGAFRAGAGLGVRYHTTIGPIRLDVATPLIRQRKSGAVQVYAGIGQAF